ncbi:MAG: hypothetical protein M3Q48_00555 [Actinomycetota bacterium]|nr:hypothetical protein [Actinomycetota bacterium]
MNTYPFVARRLLAVARAVVLAAGLALAACGSGGSPSAGGTTTTTTTAAEAPSYRVDGSPTDLGAGEVMGVTGDGVAAYVAAENPSSSVAGCEGMPAPYLYRAPLDGGTRTLAAPASAQPVAGAVLRRAGSTTVVVVDQCEGFLSRLLVATEEPGGTLRDPKQVDRRVVDDVSPFSLVWSAAGDTLIGVRDRREIVRIDPVKGTSERLADVQEGVKAAELADATLVVLTTQGLTIGGRTHRRAGRRPGGQPRRRAPRRDGRGRAGAGGRRRAHRAPRRRAGGGTGLVPPR